MGADLYIRSITDKASEEFTPLFDIAVEMRHYFQEHGDKGRSDKAQDLVGYFYDAMYPKEGYFRDSYNGTSVFFNLGLSWWKDVGDMLNKKGNLSPTRCRKLIEMIEVRECRRLSAEELKEEGCQVDEAGLNSPEGWFEYYREKRLGLIGFLQRAADMKEYVHCSI